MRGGAAPVLLGARPESHAAGSRSAAAAVEGVEFVVHLLVQEVGEVALLRRGHGVVFDLPGKGGLGLDGALNLFGGAGITAHDGLLSVGGGTLSCSPHRPCETGGSGSRSVDGALYDEAVRPGVAADSRREDDRLVTRRNMRG